MKRCAVCGKQHNCNGNRCNSCSRLKYTLPQALMTAALYMELEAENTDIDAYAKELLKQAAMIKHHAKMIETAEAKRRGAIVSVNGKNYIINGR